MSNEEELNKQKYTPEWNWLGRNLENYKSMQMPVAESRGVANELLKAKTLTQARKIVYGYKRKNIK